MKKIFLVIIVFASSMAIAKAQRGGGGDENPYAKIYTETNPGKRTARCIKNLLPPNDYRGGKFNFSPCNEFVELTNTGIQQFEEFINFFVSSEKDDKQMKIAEKQFNTNGSKSSIENINFQIGYLEKQGTFTSDNITPIENLLCKAKGAIQSIKCSKAYLEGVKKIFPATPQLDEGIKLADDALAAYPDNKSIMAVIKKNLGASLAEVSFPKAVTQNAEWEGWFKTWFAQKYNGYVQLKQSLLTKDWYIKKNEISGLPEYRQIGTAIGAKAANGKCYIIKIDIFQDYIGGKFGTSRFDEYDKKEILCENLR